MKKIYILLSGVLFSSMTLAAPPILVDIQFRCAFKHRPQAAINIIPGTYLRYSKKRFHLLLFDGLLKKGQPFSQWIYLPTKVQRIKPILAFQEKNNIQRYWYCKKSLPFAVLRDNAQKKIPKYLVVKINKLPLKTILRGSGSQILSCTYRFIAQKKLHHQRG